MSLSPRIHREAWLICVTILAAGCGVVDHSPQRSRALGLLGRKTVAYEEISRILERQAQAWNAGDIDAFMVPYWHSPDLTFSSGGEVTRGWQATLERYQQRYPTPEAMGCLSFSDIEVTQPGPNVALVLGRWSLERAEPIGGAFSLVLRKDEELRLAPTLKGVGADWVILHDHTSTDPP